MLVYAVNQFSTFRRRPGHLHVSLPQSADYLLNIRRYIRHSKFLPHQDYQFRGSQRTVGKQQIDKSITQEQTRYILASGEEKWLKPK